jgi:hypothetical protein
MVPLSATACSPAARTPTLWPMRTGWAWAVFGAFAAHNLEEALAAPAYFDRMAGRLPIPWPDAAVFQAGTALVTVAGLVLTIIAVRGSRPGPVTLIASVMLANVLIPHVPLAVFSGGYAPGVVTALALNLPVDLLWLLRHRNAESRDGTTLGRPEPRPRPGLR